MGDQSSSSMVLAVITEFTSEFRNAIDGSTDDLSLNELSGGARISFVFHELFNNGIKSIDPFDQVKDGDIRTILYNSSVISLWTQNSNSGLFGSSLITCRFRDPHRHYSWGRRRLRSS